MKSERKAADKHIAVKDLPEEDRFSQLRSEKKHFIDTIKLIAYRAETAWRWRANTWWADDARSLMRRSTRPLSTSYPTRSQPRHGSHHLTARVHDEVIAKLCEELTATETLFPGTDLRLIFQLLGSS